MRVYRFKNRTAQTHVYRDTLQYVAEIYRVKPEDIAGKGPRKQPFAEARQVVIYLLREKHLMNLEEIGSLMGYDHSTVRYGVHQIAGRIEMKQLRCNQRLLDQLNL